MAGTEAVRIDRTIELAAPPERVWNALTRAEEIAAWFQVTIEGALAPGAELWMTSVHPQSSGQRFRVRIVEMDAPRRFVWFRAHVEKAH